MSNKSNKSTNGNLTEAQKLLLQRFPNLPEDDPLVELAAWNASLEKKVDNFGESLNSWTQAILKQIDLANQQSQQIVSQNLILQKTGQTNETLGQSLLQWKQGLSLLEQEFTLQRGAISLQGSALKSLIAESERLKWKLEDLSMKLRSLETLDSLSNKVDSLTSSVKTLETRVSSLRQDLNADRWFARYALGILIILILGQYFSFGLSKISLQSQIEQVNGNVNTALLPLKWIEER